MCTQKCMGRWDSDPVPSVAQPQGHCSAQLTDGAVTTCSLSGKETEPRRQTGLLSVNASTSIVALGSRGCVLLLWVSPRTSAKYLNFWRRGRENKKCAIILFNSNFELNYRLESNGQYSSRSLKGRR